MALDYGARLFLTLPRIQSAAVYRGRGSGHAARAAAADDRPLVAAWAAEKWAPLCFVHAAGSKKEAFAREKRGFNFSVLGIY